MTLIWDTAIVLRRDPSWSQDNSADITSSIFWREPFPDPQNSGYRYTDKTF